MPLDRGKFAAAMTRDCAPAENGFQTALGPWSRWPAWRRQRKIAREKEEAMRVLSALPVSLAAAASAQKKWLLPDVEKIAQ
jgi:hypothetical protein